jgi:hypothetical protein
MMGCEANLQEIEKRECMGAHTFLKPGIRQKKLLPMRDMISYTGKFLRFSANAVWKNNNRVIFLRLSRLGRFRQKLGFGGVFHQVLIITILWRRVIG